MKIQLSVLLLSVLISCYPVFAVAETVTLKSGNTIEGKILERTNEGIKIDFQGVVLTLYSDEIDHIDGQDTIVSTLEGNAAQQMNGADASTQTISPSDHRDVYGEGLSKLILLCTKSDSAENECRSAADQLFQFSKDFPESRFVRDAKFMSKFYLFIKSVTGGDKEQSARLLSEIAAIVSLYPNELLEEFTSQKISELDPDSSPYMPFRFAIPYCQGGMNLRFEDFQSSIENFSSIKRDFNLAKDGNSLFLQNVYEKLIKAYMRANKIDEGKALMNETIDMFPDSSLAQELRVELEGNDAQ